MVRRIFAIVLIVLGLCTIGAAVASGTIWRPADQVTLTLPGTPDVPVVVTAPGVLNAVDNDVDVRIVGATAQTPLVLAMAPDTDVNAWVGDSPHWEVTGLADWETLSYTDSRDQADEPTEEPTDADPSATESASPSESASATEAPAEGEEPEEATVPDPRGSDLWVEQVTGTGSLEYSWTAVPGRWMMLVAADGTEAAPQIELTWDRPVTTPFVLPGVILGGVLLLLGLTLLVMQLLVDREHRRSRTLGTAAVTTAAAEPAVAPVDGDRPLTRREIRLAETQARGGRPARTSPAVVGEETESIPVVSDAAPDDDQRPADEPETAAEDQAAVAGELDAWVRGGAASPLPHEVDRTTPTDLTPADEDDPAQTVAPVEPAETAPAAEAAPERQAREPWWRRRRREDRGEQAAADTAEDEAQPEEATPGDTRTQPSTPSGVGGDTEQIPVISPDDDPPAVSGASWRQAWGFEQDDKPRAEDDR